MKTKKYCSILAVLIAALCVPALGDVELRLLDNKPVLLDKPNLALAGIDKLHVVIVPPDAEPNKDGLVWRELEAKVISKLNEAGIRITPGVAGSILNIPELRVFIDMLKLDDSQRYVSHIQTSLASKVSLVKLPRRYIKADVWKVGPVMQATTVKNMPAAVTNAVLNQVETFISCYQIANPKPVRPADANSIATAPKRPATQIIKPRAAKYKYVASKKRRVFHRPECNSAKRIKPENLIAYNSRIEAIKAGKRPCKRCKP